MTTPDATSPDVNDVGIVLTPTEDLILEVLAARYRLGEQLWTFSSRHGRALSSLESKGFIGLMGGIVEHTARAYLTDSGKREALSETYATARDARVAAETLDNFADLVDSRYPKHVFPDDSSTTDGIAGTMGRLVANQARAEAAEMRADEIQRGAL